MKKNKYVFVLLLLIAISVVAFGGTFLYLKVNNRAVADNEFVIMTSCNPMYIATLNVTEDVEGVRVENLSQPTTGCLHDYTLTAEDMKNLSRADVLVINGLGMEGYLDDVISAYPDLPIIRAGEEVSFIGEGQRVERMNELFEENSHTWLSEQVYIGEVSSIAYGLKTLDEAHGEQYIENAKNYTNYVDDVLVQDLDELKGFTSGSNVVLLHEAYEYIALDLEMEVVGVMDLDEERQVSAGEVAQLLDTIRANDVKIVLAERDYGEDMGKIIEEQTDAKVVYLNTLIHGSYSAEDYEIVMDKNYEAISNVL